MPRGTAPCHDLCAGYGVTTVLALVATLRADWPHLARLAQKRSEAPPTDDCITPADGCVNADQPLVACPQLMPLNAATLSTHALAPEGLVIAGSGR